MKLVKASQDIAIPDDVKLEVKARKIRVTGPRGEHPVSFRHICLGLRFMTAQLSSSTYDSYWYCKGAVSVWPVPFVLVSANALTNRYFDQRFQALGS